MKQYILAFLVAFSAAVFALAEDAALGVSEIKKSQQIETEKSYYAGLNLGMGGYPQVKNVDRGYNFSVVGGYYISKKISAEIGAGVAKSQLISANLLVANRVDTFNIDQYQFLISSKYTLSDLAGLSIKPAVGVAVAYTYRSYNQLNGLTTNSGKTGNSLALDAGLGLGLEYDISEKYAVGFDTKYMFNLSHQINANYANPSYGYNGIALESLEYYIATLTAKMNF